tara:strand:- start:734 stop:1543 length:810 start_codon:yes stop_codon:yes gene_type:complete
MNSSFIRALWGDTPETCPEQPTVTRRRTTRDINHTIERSSEPAPCRYYTFGGHNTEFLKGIGLEPIHLYDEGIVNWWHGLLGKPTERKTKHNDDGGRINWGLNFWRHKLMVIVNTFKDGFDEIVWLDWDIRLTTPDNKVPANFWDKIRQGPSIQMALRAYCRPQCPWRDARNESGRENDYQWPWDRWMPHGAFIYCRDVEIIKQVIGHHDTWHTCTDETAFARYFEDEAGGKWGEKEAIESEKKHRPYCYVSRGRVSEPDEIVFSNLGR